MKKVKNGDKTRHRDMRQSLCRWITNNEHSKWTVHRRGSMQLPTGLTKKASCDPSQSYGIKLRHDIQRCKSKIPGGQTITRNRAFEQAHCSPCNNHPSLQYTSKQGRVSQGGRSKENKWSEYSDPRCTTGTRQNSLLALCETKCPTVLQVHTDKHKMSACSAHHALGSTSEVRTPSCSRALTRLRNTENQRTGQKRHSHPTESNTAEPQPSTDTLCFCWCVMPFDVVGAW